MKFLYCAILAVLLASCAFGLGGCVTITLYPEYMTGCIGALCSCPEGAKLPARNADESMNDRRLERIIK